MTRTKLKLRLSTLRSPCVLADATSVTLASPSSALRAPGLGGCFAGSFLYYVMTIITPRLELLFWLGIPGAGFSPVRPC